MNFQDKEIVAIAEVEVAAVELSELQLAAVGGGTGELVLI